MSIKNPMTPAGIEPATFRFVAQNLNHCATAVPYSIMSLAYLKEKGAIFFEAGTEFSKLI